PSAPRRAPRQVPRRPPHLAAARLLPGSFARPLLRHRAQGLVRPESDSARGAPDRLAPRRGRARGGSPAGEPSRRGRARAYAPSSRGARSRRFTARDRSALMAAVISFRPSLLAVALTFGAAGCGTRAETSGCADSATGCAQGLAVLMDF